MRQSIFITSAVLFSIFIANMLSMIAAFVSPEKPSVNYVEFVTILLMVVTIVLAALGIGIAILAIWGYQTISQNTRDAADKKASEVAGIKIDCHLNGEPFERQLRELIAKVQAEQAVQSIQVSKASEKEGGKEHVNASNDIPVYPDA